MSSVQEIERAIETLKPEEFQELIAWLDEHAPLTDARIAPDLQQLADTRLKAALDHGHFDEMIKSALEEEAAGLTTPL